MIVIIERLLILYMIIIKLNGEDFECDTPIDIYGLLEVLEIDNRSVAIELNLEIVPKSLWEQTILKSGDRIELVQFVGGGI